MYAEGRQLHAGVVEGVRGYVVFVNVFLCMIDFVYRRSWSISRCLIR
jgi:hypothetical protein